MMRTGIAAAVMIALTMSAAAEAERSVMRPVQYGYETVRYEQNVPVLELRGAGGVVQITPLPMDHGCPTFGIIVFNDSNRPADIDIADVTAMIGAERGTVLTATELQKRASNRAFWTSMAIAAVSGLAAGVAAASTAHTTVRTHTSHGTYVSKVSYHSGANAANGALIGGAGAAAVGSVQHQLDATRVAIDADILQLTTVGPGDSYGARVVIDRIRGPLPQTILLTISWNHAIYTTKWQLAAEGTPAPVFTAVASPPSASEASLPQGGSPARLGPAVLVVEKRREPLHEGIKPNQPLAPAKRYPHDDTVEIPM